MRGDRAHFVPARDESLGALREQRLAAEEYSAKPAIGGHGLHWELRAARGRAGPDTGPHFCVLATEYERDVL